MHTNHALKKHWDANRAMGKMELERRGMVC